MDPNNDDWLIDIVGSFIHSSIWIAPIYSFIEGNCASFDYDIENAENETTVSSSSSAATVDEQMTIYQEYQRLVDSLIEGLSKDFDLDQNKLKKVCQPPTTDNDSVMIDEAFEQLYAARNFSLFQEMMKRKNLILQLQALVTLQLQWGLLKHGEAGDDLILALLLQATTISSSSRHQSGHSLSERIETLPEDENEYQPHQKEEDNDDDDVVIVQEEQLPSSSSSLRNSKKPRERKKAATRQYHLPDVRLKSGPELDAQWYRDLQQTRQQVFALQISNSWNMFLFFFSIEQ